MLLLSFSVTNRSLLSFASALRMLSTLRDYLGRPNRLLGIPNLTPSKINHSISQGLFLSKGTWLPKIQGQTNLCLLFIYL
jgi:hypothetical protein